MKSIIPSMLGLALTIAVVAVQAAPATRIALVCDDGSGKATKVLDLAAVKLGKDKKIELLDREAIRRVLNEQNLSLAGAVNPNSVVSAGRLLSVDLFAVVETVMETNGTTKAASAVAAGLAVFDAKTGVRLLDATLPADGVEKLAESVATGVLMAQRKQTAIGLPTICLMSVRNADLPRSLDSLCDSVGLLLERRLMASPNCAVLERRRLDQVNKERELPGNTGQQQLLASLVIMEMECSRGPNGRGMRAKVRLTNNNGKWLADFSVTNQNANADELARRLYQKVAEALKLGSSASKKEDRDKESGRFRQEAEFFLSHGDWEHGVAGLEAAFALNPGNLGLQRQLAGTLICYAGAQTNLINNLRIADRGTEMFVEYARKAHSAAKPTGHRATYSFASYFPEWSDYMKNFNAGTLNDPHLSPSEMAEARQLLHTVYARFRAFRVELALPALSETVLQHPDDSKYEGRALFHDYEFVLLTGLWVSKNFSALYPEDWSQHWLASLKAYLDFLEQLSLKRELAETEEIDWGLSQLLSWPPTWERVRPAEREEAWRLMAGHSSPFIRALGKLSQLNAAQEEAEQKNASLPPVDQTCRLYVQDCLNNPVQTTNLIVSRLLYEVAGQIGGAERVEFCNFMLQRNDLHPDTLNQTTAYLLSQTNKESAFQAIKLYDRAAALFQQPNVRYFGGSDTNQYLQDLAKQRAIAQQKFDGITEPPLPPLPPAWREARQLIDLAGAKKGLTQIFRPVVQGDSVYAAGFGMDETDGGPFLQLLRISFNSGMVEWLSKIAVHGVEPKTACIDKNNYYLGTSRGIFIFPKTGGTVRWVDQNDGLPADEVTALDCLDGKLYAGLGESGYLVSYDLKQRQCEVLCSARRKEQLSPFDNGSPLRIPIIVADEAKHRIVFLTDQDGGGGGSGELEKDLRTAKQSNGDVFSLICARARAGMWSYNPADHEFKCILPRWPNANYYDADWVGRVSETQIAFVCRISRGMALFDSTTDKPTLLAGSCIAIGLWSGVEETLQKRGMIVNPAFHCPPLMGNRVIVAGTASFMHDDWIWSAGQAGNGWVGNTFSRVSMNTGQKEELPPLRASDRNFAPGECFCLIGSNQALMGDRQGLWLVTFAADEVETRRLQGRAGMEGTSK